jgi:TRAP-type transport system periplasmic protein
VRTRKHLISLFAGAIALAAPLAAAEAAPMQLKFAFIGPPTNAMHKQGIGRWAEKVTADSGGEVAVKVFNGPSLATLFNAYDRLQNGVIEVTYATVGPIVTQFPKTTVSNLPFVAENSTEASLALWRLYERGLIADEFAKVHPVAIITFADVSIHARKPFKTMDDIAGWKIGAQSRLTGQVIEKLGATAISMPVNEFYQSLQRGTIDGAGTAWPAIMAFKIIEVVNTHLEEPLSGEAAFCAMNKSIYAKLPAKAKAAVDKYSGEIFSRWLGEAIDGEFEHGRAAARKMANHTLVKLSPDERKRWEERLAPVTAQWVKSTPNGAAVLTAFREEIAKIRAGK